MKEMRSDMKDGFAAANAKADKNFDILNNKIDVLSENTKVRFESMEKSEEEIKEVQKKEIIKLDEIYALKNKIEFKWTKKFIGFNAGISACVAWVTTMWTK